MTALKTSTAGGPPGFFIQDGTTKYGGMFVATKDPPTVKVGNKVDVTGDYEEVNGLSQLSNAAITVVDPGTKLALKPIEVDPKTYGSFENKGAAGEPWETMLCVVKGPIAVSVMNADGNEDKTKDKDYDEFAITDVKLRIDDALFEGLDNNYPVGSAFKEIVGICSFAFGNRKIWPRSASDVVLAEGGVAPPNDPGGQAPPGGPSVPEDDRLTDPAAAARRAAMQERGGCSSVPGTTDVRGSVLLALGLALVLRKRRQT